MNSTEIKNTAAFKELDRVTQTIYSEKKMMDRVNNELEIAKYIGLENYFNTYHPRPYLWKVIKELIITQNK